MQILRRFFRRQPPATTASGDRLSDKNILGSPTASQRTTASSSATLPQQFCLRLTTGEPHYVRSTAPPPSPSTAGSAAQCSPTPTIGTASTNCYADSVASTSSTVLPRGDLPLLPESGATGKTMSSGTRKGEKSRRKSGGNASSVYSSNNSSVTGEEEASATAKAVAPTAAREWPCSSCATLLGACHMAGALALLIFDVATNAVTAATFPVSAALAFFVAAILAFIAARRLDRLAETLLLLTSTLCCALCALMFVESARRVNDTLTIMDGGGGGDGRLDATALVNCAPDAILERCAQTFITFHSFIVCVSLMEFVIFGVTIIVCFRSLRNAYRVQNAKSPYSMLIVGDYTKLSATPKLKRFDDERMRRHQVEKVLRI